MGRPVDFEKKIEELRGYLIKYNGIPKQTEDRAAHMNLRYYFIKHNDKPEIKALVEEFHLSELIQNINEAHIERSIEEIKEILEKYQRIPKDTKDYQAVYYFFKNHQDDPEVIRLMYIYVHPKCYNQVTGKRLYVTIDGEANRPNYNFTTACKYVKFVYENFKELPARNTIPILAIRWHFKRKYPFKEKDKYDALRCYKYTFLFFREMSELGCPDEELFQFMTIEKTDE